MISALFRDYAFLTSAYVLEPVDVEFRKTGKYTTGRNVLPRELAVPMKKLADARTTLSIILLDGLSSDTPHSQSAISPSWNTPVSMPCRTGLAKIQPAISLSIISSLSERSRTTRDQRKDLCASSYDKITERLLK
jgi:hypothetical protein